MSRNLSIGLPPKRAFLFRTNAPFRKLSVTFVAREEGGKEDKLEFLGDGQQVIVHGIHPDTQKPYEWFGDAPGEIAREDLLGDVTGRPGLQRLDRDVLAAVGRHEDYWQTGVTGADGLHQFQAVYLGHEHVGQHQKSSDALRLLVLHAGR